MGCCHLVILLPSAGVASLVCPDSSWLLPRGAARRSFQRLAAWHGDTACPRLGKPLPTQLLSQRACRGVVQNQRFLGHRGRTEAPVHEGRIRFEGGFVGRRPTSPGQARRGWIGPRPSRVNQCGWPWPVINSRGLLPLRSARRLRMKRRWFKKNRSKIKYEPPRWRRSVK
jgi:hypothetical protein